MLVALLAEKADIQYDCELTDPGQLVNEIQSLGFGANLLSDGDSYQQGKIDLTVSLCAVYVWSILQVSSHGDEGSVCYMYLYMCCMYMFMCMHM